MGRQKDTTLEAGRRHPPALHWAWAIGLLCALTAEGCRRDFNLEPHEARYDGRVYLLRGLLNWWSTGMDEVGRKLHKAGVNSVVMPGPEWLAVGQRIVKEPPDGPLVLVGHSFGADDAVRLARYLRDQGVTVDGLVLVDPTTPPVVPDNVVRCFNLFKSNPPTDWMPWFRGVAVNTEDPRTQLVNYDLRENDPTGRYANLDHFNIDNDDNVQEVVITEVKRSLRRSAVWD